MKKKILIGAITFFTFGVILFAGLHYTLKYGLSSHKDRINSILAPGVLDFSELSVDMFGGVRAKNLTLKKLDGIEMQIEYFDLKYRFWSLFFFEFDVESFEASGLKLRLRPVQKQKEQEVELAKEKFKLRRFLMDPPLRFNFRGVSLNDISIELVDHDGSFKIENFNQEGTFVFKRSFLNIKLKNQFHIRSKHKILNLNGRYNGDISIHLSENEGQWKFITRFHKLDLMAQDIEAANQKIDSLSVSQKVFLSSKFKDDEKRDILALLVKNIKTDLKIQANVEGVHGDVGLSTGELRINSLEGGELSLSKLKIPDREYANIKLPIEIVKNQFLVKLFLNGESLFKAEGSVNDNKDEFQLDVKTLMQMKPKLKRWLGLEDSITSFGYWGGMTRHELRLIHGGSSIFDYENHKSYSIQTKNNIKLKQLKKGKDLTYAAPVQVTFSSLTGVDAGSTRVDYNVSGVEHPIIGALRVKGDALLDVDSPIQSKLKLTQTRKGDLLFKTPLEVSFQMAGKKIGFRIAGDQITYAQAGSIGKFEIEGIQNGEQFKLNGFLSPLINDLEHSGVWLKNLVLELNAVVGEKDLILKMFKVKNKNILLNATAAHSEKKSEILGEVSVKMPNKISTLKKGRGSVYLPFKLQVENGEDLVVDGKLIFKQIGFLLNDLKIAGLDGEVTLNEHLKIGEKFSFASVDSLNPFERVDYLKQEPLIEKSASLNGAEIIFGDHKMNQLTSKVYVKQNLLVMPKFDLGVNGGALNGSFYLDFLPKKMNVGILARFNGIKPQKGDPEGIDGRVALMFDFSSRLLGGRIDIVKISRENLISLLEIVDPDYEDSNINSLRSTLKLTFPEFVSLDFEGGSLALNVNLSSGLSFNIKHLPVSGFMNMIVAQIENVLSEVPIQ